MTRDETKQVLMVMQAAYPNYHPQNKTVTTDLWATMLSDYDYQAVIVALQAYIATDTSGFAPSIGQVIGKLSDLMAGDELTPMEAWAMVRKAIGNSGYHSREEFDRLPPDVQRAVGSPEQLYAWAMDAQFNAGVVMSQFIKSYSVAVQRRCEMAKLPMAARNLIEGGKHD